MDFAFFERVPFAGYFLVIELILFWALVRVLLKGAMGCARRARRSGENPLVAAISVPILLCLISAIALRGSSFCTHVEPIPDAVEYSAVAKNLCTQGEFGIVLEGQSLPSRYPVWFPLLIVLPGYLVLGSDIANAIEPVWLLGMLGVIAGYFAAYRIAGIWAGIVSAGLLLLMPSYRYFSCQSMTDIPVAAVLLLCLLAWQALQSDDDSQILDYVAPGILLALVAGMRITGIFGIIPFVLHAIFYERRRKFMKCVMLLLPLVGVMNSSAAINQGMFGSSFRTGYHVWLAVPYDYWWLTFSPRYLAANAEALFMRSEFSPFALSLCAFWTLRKKFAARIQELGLEPQKILDVLLYTAGACLPLIFLHLFYFYSTVRFYLPLNSLLAVLVGCCAAGAFAKLRWRNMYQLFAVFAFGILAMLRTLSSTGAAGWQKTAQVIREQTPADALIISAMNPVLLQIAANEDDTQRNVIPLSREAEYASKVLVRKRVWPLEPPVGDPQQHRAEALIRGGAVEAVPLVATEQIDYLKQLIAKGQNVFVDTSEAKQEEVALLRKSFAFKKIATGLYQLGLPAVSIDSGVV